MSVLFGRWQFDGRPVAREYLEKLESQVAEYGPDGRGLYSKGGITVGYRAFHTTFDARPSAQPYVSVSGAIITWDGRLDNRHELILALGSKGNHPSSDVELIGAAYAAWKDDCFARFLGDWAVVIWDPVRQTLHLATDFVGARHLYYMLDDEQICWSTILDPLVLDSARRLSLSEEYVAGWLAGFPRPQLTPYNEIHAIAPAICVSVRNHETTIRKYWDFDPRKTTRCRCDAEYEEQFRALFSQAVRRRLRSNSPVVAELSGGMDSSSIVCMADRLLGREHGLASRLDTVSYYSDSEPNWDDRHYFTIVEQRRQRSGCHIEVGSTPGVEIESLTNAFAATPAAVLRAPKSRDEFSEYIRAQGNRVLLSGIGGDEVLGGVPTAIPELADLLAGAKLRSLLQRAIAWALVQRKPLLHLLYETCREFLPSSAGQDPSSWLAPQITGKPHSEGGSTGRIRVFGAPPSFQYNLRALEVLRRQLGCSPLSSNPLLEMSYPYLDRDLLEFLFSIPREQVIRPGQRRSLMRRALTGIVPDEVLNRKRKAFVVRAPLSAVSAYWSELTAQDKTMVCETMGLVDRRHFSESLCAVRDGAGAQLLQLSRTLTLELWLRHIRGSGVLGRTGEPTGESATVGVSRLS